MSGDPFLAIYLEDGSYERAVAGRHNFVAQIRKAVEPQGWQVEVRNTAVGAPLDKSDYALVHMKAPFGDRALTFRKAYLGAFWRIERTPIRADFDVARRVFVSSDIDPARARAFADRWRRLEFGDLAQEPQSEGFVYIPLQAHLCDRRSGQYLAPIDMLREVLRQEPRRWLVATLHSGWKYSPNELSALNSLIEDNPRLSIGTAPPRQLLRDCDYVVTENSSVAFCGYFFRKPAVLFAGIDFHHIGFDVQKLGSEGAFAAAQTTRPEYDTYLFWFLRMNAIGAGRADAPLAIRDALSRHGWPIMP